MRYVVTAIFAALALVGCGGSGAVSGGAGGSEAGSDELRVSASGWKTDFSKHSVALSEFVGGGPGKDGIPSIDEPKFIDVEGADDFLADREPVAVVEVEGETRGYPIQILIWHEIVNDEIAGVPIAVTYCPLCNSTVAFERRIDGRPVEFGTTGNLRSSDLVMYDRETESWWQQITAEAVVGELTGTKLEVIPSQVLSWEQFKRIHPDGEVLSRDTGFSRNYGSNPYVGYEGTDRPFLLGGRADPALPATERVAAVQTGKRSAAVYPFSRLRKEAPLNDEIEGRPVVVLYDPDVASALDAPGVSQGRKVGAAAVFSRALGGRTLTFEGGSEAGSFRDRETGSTWNMSGEGASGPLEGRRLERVTSDDQFWFAIAAFFEDAEIRD